jgi:signal transduction histidine kinase/ActR/RegA family two-component response regulator
LTLLGWWLGAPGLLEWGGHGIAMKANAGVCAVLGGGALLVLCLDGPSRLARALASGICVVAGLTLLEHLTGVNLGIDTLLFEEAPGAAATAAPGRMGPPASTSFSVVGACLWLVTGGPRARRVGCALAIVPIVIALLGIVGYLYDASQLFAVARLTGVALQTATMIAALGIGLIALVPEHGFFATVRRVDPGGVMFRRLLVPLLFLPPVIGWLRVGGERAGLYDSAFGTAVRTIFEMVLFVGIVWWTAEGVSRHARVARKAEQALREADRRKDEFLATLAHELRNPLAPLRTALDLIRQSPDDAAVARRAHATMERQLRQMVHLVDDLLDVNRISRGSVELRQEPVELARVLENAIETSRPVVDGFRHELVVVQPGEPVFVRGDLTRLAQVIGNLVNNAAKYTEPGGRIRIKVEREGDEVLVRVRDNGLGIPADVLPRMFEMFSRVSRPQARSAGGLGIGLALVKQLVELHGGRVAVHSPPPEEPGEPAAGSEFVVRLPVLVHALEVAPPRAVAATETGTAPAPLRILIADDNVDAGETLALLLETMGHETRTTHDGVEALEGAASMRPEVAFLDIGMPRLDGYEVCRRIRSEPWGKAVVLIALTGWGDADDRSKSSEAGFDHHLVKPADLESLEEILTRVRAGDRPASPARSG